MIKKYYQSLHSLKYSLILPGLTFLIFVIAYIRDKKHNSSLTTVLIILVALLAVIMVFYYLGKVRISKQLKTIENLDAYKEGGMVDKSWILENRILSYHQGVIQEINVSDIQSMKVEEGKHGKYTFIFNDHVKMSCQDLSEGRRLLALLLKANPSIHYQGLEPEGNGRIQSLGGKKHE
ncbi:hypothetical protein [Bulleidia sp. zg-1006]|uniref:hypothetical protein n=1 Tax=Bulleidia sp. zg-1006 TaxID=2806552 RepID=UPI0019393B5D|nr:hypothetical protein [Bulleidia sp. zg-1006]QRG86768.1 hypothetical protein JOS54_00150 [Bulleidia sp. zg-1006]